MSMREQRTFFEQIDEIDKILKKANSQHKGVDMVPVIAIKGENEDGGDLYWRLDDATTAESFLNYFKSNVSKGAPAAVYVEDLTPERWKEIEDATKELNGEV